MLLFAMKTALTEKAYRMGNKLFAKTAKNAKTVRVLWIILLSLGALDLLGTLIFSAVWEIPVSPRAFVLPGCLVILYAVVPLLRRAAVNSAVKKYRDIGRFGAPEALCFFEDRIECKSANGTFTCTWAQIDRMAETKDLFLLVSGNMLIHISAEFIDEPAFAYLRGLLIQKCGGWKLHRFGGFCPCGKTELPEGIALNDLHQPVEAAQPAPSEEELQFTLTVPAEKATPFLFPLVMLEGLMAAVSALAGVSLYLTTESLFYGIGTGAVSFAVCQIIVLNWVLSERKRRKNGKATVINGYETHLTVSRDGIETVIPRNECVLVCGNKNWNLMQQTMPAASFPKELLSEEACAWLQTHCTVR